MTNLHSNIASESHVVELEKRVGQLEKLLHRLLYKSKPKGIKKEVTIKKKIAEMLRQNIDRNNSLVAKRIQHKQK